MLLSKWRINRIGLIDFWYYDDEEYLFQEGRLLLRGSNGSGKSVTMQSFIPLLLDGNKAAERLDPFGTKARRLDNYLLEENDGREERTGYLYMEFKREDSDTYTTIGIGLHAKRNKKLDSWHFIIQDGRRVGHDFYLYKDIRNKITLSKLELKNRLDMGGRVLESQREYMKLVNETLFGYETVEEYKELVDLLIQLRTPKLSKDFKPTLLNEILSNSLPPLSDEDLRPMSEAIENMDSLKSRLDELEASKKSADKIFDVFEQYNKAVLYERAKLFTDTKNQYDETQKLEESMTKQKEQLKLDYENEIVSEQELKDEEEVLLEKKKRLDLDDLSKLAEEKVTLEEKLKLSEADYREKEKEVGEKKEKETQLHLKKKEERQKAEQWEAEILSCLKEMEECFEVFSFDEHSFMEAELKKGLDENYSFGIIKQELNQSQRELEQGILLLMKKKQMDEELEKAEVALVLTEQKIQNTKKQQEEHLLQLSQVKEEWIEHFYQWLRSNAWLKLSPELETKLVQRIHSYHMKTNIYEGMDAVKAVKDELQNNLQKEKLRLEHEHQVEEDRLSDLQKQLAGWKEKKDPEPERAEEVTHNRNWLREQQIPFFPFYQILDFAEQVNEERKNQIEEMLYSMGLLDAVVIPTNYREKVLKRREGMCDTYLFATAEQLKKNIGELIEIATETTDIVFYQELAAILKNIGLGKAGHTWIDEEGNFGLGILQGNITHSYQSRFIGVNAREQYRLSMIDQLEGEVRNQEKQIEQYEEHIREKDDNIQALLEEYSRYPLEEDIRLALKDLENVIEVLEKLEKEQKERKEELQNLKKQLQEISLEVTRLCKKFYLKAELDIFQRAKEEVAQYKEGLTELEIKHKNYLHQLASLSVTLERLEEIEEDLDNLRYDLGKISSLIQQSKSRIAEYEKELKAKNYESIQEQLETCIKRLKKLPEDLKECYKKQTIYKERQSVLIDKLQQIGEELERRKQDIVFAAKILEEEVQLDFVEGVLNKEEENEKKTTSALAKKVCVKLERFYTKSSQELGGNVQQKFYENSSQLNDYYLTLKPIVATQPEEFSGYVTESFRRYVIYGKYKGKETPFADIVRGVNTDIDLQKKLIKESDRELFEDVLANTISKKIRFKIYKSEQWVVNMNGLMESMNTSSGLKLSLSWKKKKAEEEGQLDTKALVDLLKKDAGLMREEELSQLSAHFQSKVQEVRRIQEEAGNTKSFHAIMKDVLDYRRWFEFQLFFTKPGENRKELTNNAFFTFSGGEKAMSMYVPLFSAVVAKYDGASQYAPRLISLDEAFAGVDEHNIRDMFKLMVDMKFNFIINSQILWGDCDTVPSLAIYQLLRKGNEKFVTVLPYIWNGKVKKLAIQSKE